MRRTRAQGWEARDKVGEGRGGTKKHKEPQKTYRHDLENEGDLSGRRKKRRQERVAGSIYVDPGYLEIARKEGRKRTALIAQIRLSTTAERVCPLSRIVTLILYWQDQGE